MHKPALPYLLITGAGTHMRVKLAIMGKATEVRARAQKCGSLFTY